MIGANGVVFSGAAVLFRPLLTWVGNRWGRRTLMVTGSLVAAAAALGLTGVNGAWQILPLRALMGVGEAALFVGAAILVVELSPENRKAEVASYLSVAVFGGLSVGPIIGELVMGDVAESARGLNAGHFNAVFVVTAGAAVLAALVSLTAPAFVGERPERIRRKSRGFIRVLYCLVRSWLSVWLRGRPSLLLFRHFRNQSDSVVRRNSLRSTASCACSCACLGPRPQNVLDFTAVW